VSGIYIPGMEMPVCHFKTSETYNVHGFWMVYPDGKSKLHIMVDSNHWVCEVIPVPDHGRLIDADEFCTEHRSLKLLGRVGIRRFNWHVAAAAFVEDTPTIIPASTTDKEEEK